MIERLVGRCVHRGPAGIILDVNGVGYGLEMPETALLAPAGDSLEMTVWVHTYVREDAIKLFGFLSQSERQLFLLLISVSDVGPKVAMAILSRMSVRQLCDAVLSEDLSTFQSVPGIGDRKSRKIVLELKPKVEKLLKTLGPGAYGQEAGSKTGGLFASEEPKESAVPDPSLVSDLRSALLNLGYKEREVQPVIKKVLGGGGAPAGLGDLLRQALSHLATPSSVPATIETPALDEVF